MLSKLQTLSRTGLVMATFLAAASAQNHYVVRVSSSKIKDICGRHGMQFVTALGGSASGLHVVNSPLSLQQVIQSLKSEPDVQSVEQDLPMALPETSKTAAVTRTVQSFGNLAATIKRQGTSDWALMQAYLNQPAVSILQLSQAHKLADGAGTVAVLDTGIDFFHPALWGSVVLGYDFINHIPGGYATPMDLNQAIMTILDQSTTSILDQSTTSILDTHDTLVLDQSTTSILDQSTSSILDQSTTSILDSHKPVSDYGHGTMVASVIHLVAPNAKLLPVKVFDANGGSSLSLIIQGIHYAVDNGARVINMSFSMQGSSQELKTAIAWAVSQGAILVAAAGNEGQQMTVYPAGYDNVIGVGATEDAKTRAPYSNFGSVVDLAAPGSGIITAYPSNRYAAGWGTSFSAPMVAGMAALLLDLDTKLTPQSALTDADKATPLPGQLLGAGLLNPMSAIANVHPGPQAKPGETAVKSH